MFRNVGCSLLIIAIATLPLLACGQSDSPPRNLSTASVQTRMATPPSPMAKVSIEELDIDWGALEEFFSIEGPGVDILRGYTVVTIAAVSKVSGPIPQFKAKFYDAEGSEVSGSSLGLQSPFNLLFFPQNNPTESNPASWTLGQRSRGRFFLPGQPEVLARIKSIRIIPSN